MVFAGHVWEDEVSAQFLGGGQLSDGELTVDDLLLNDDITYTFTIGRATVQMRTTVSPTSVDIGGDIRTFDPTSAAVPLLEDLSCPAVGS